MIEPSVTIYSIGTVCTVVRYLSTFLPITNKYPFYLILTTVKSGWKFRDKISCFFLLKNLSLSKCKVYPQPQRYVTEESSAKFKL